MTFIAPPADKPTAPLTSPSTSAIPLSFRAFLIATFGVLVIWLPVLWLHLTLVLFSALIAYALISKTGRMLARIINRALPRLSPTLQDALTQWLAIIGLIGLTSLGVYVFGDWVADKASIDTFNRLLLQIMQIFDQLHELLPETISQHLPVSVSSFQATLMTIIKGHTPQLQLLGIHTLRGVGYVLAGLIIGTILSLQLPLQRPYQRPLSRLLHRHFINLLTGFSQVFFAQVQISFINTLLTGVYLLGILPLVGHPLPMAWTVVLITFCAGLLPVVGNLMSNTIIVLLSLTHGLSVSIASLLWLVSIHKLEYFLNAQIIGNKIQAKAWELLLFMLLAESVFGLAGVVAAPIIYAQLKRAYIERGWV